MLLTGRYQAQGGSLLYETSESIFTAKAPEVVNPGAEYPRSTASPGAALVASVSKWGQDVPVTDEHIGRYGRRAVDVSLLKITNYLVKQVDALCMSVINASISSNTQAATVIWSTMATADPLLDLMKARAVIIGRDQGYDPDTVVMSDLAYAYLVSNQKIISGLQRESDTSVTRTGDVLTIAGMRILSTNNMPGGITADAFVIDSTMLGGIGYERIPSPEYNGDPATGVESWSRRDPAANDMWIIRGRRPIVPIVQEPFAVQRITGVST